MIEKDCHQNNCLASEFDNIWLNPIKNKIVDRKTIHFYQKFESLSEARVISDHVPLYVELEFL